MGAAVPTQDTALAAVVTAMDAMSPDIGNVYNGFHTLEDDISFIVRNSLIVSGSMDAWFVDLVGVDESEGPATQEFYEVYEVQIRYWSLRTGDADWSKKARIQAELVRDSLTGVASVFAISGQRQLHTPETVSIVSHGQAEIRGDEGAQLVYLTVLRLQIEARRWT